MSSVGELADTMADASPWPLVVLALLAGVGAPIVEELAFRGLLFGALEKRGQGQVACVLISAVAFALFHFEPVRFPVLLVIGLALGTVRARHRVDAGEHRRPHGEQPAGVDLAAGARVLLTGSVSCCDRLRWAR